MAKKTPAAASDASPATRTYDVMSPLNHDQVDYAIGSTVALTDVQATPLLSHTVRVQQEPEPAPAQD